MTREHFDSTILKRTADGETVLSSYLDDGEELVKSDQDVNLVSDKTATEQPTLTTDETNTHTVGGSEEIEQNEETEVTDQKNDDGSATGTSSDVNQTNETQTPTTTEQQSDAKAETADTKKTSNKK